MFAEALCCTKQCAKFNLKIANREKFHHERKNPFKNWCFVLIDSQFNGTERGKCKTMGFFCFCFFGLFVLERERERESWLENKSHSSWIITCFQFIIYSGYTKNVVENIISCYTSRYMRTPPCICQKQQSRINMYVSNLWIYRHHERACQDTSKAAEQLTVTDYHLQTVTYCPVFKHPESIPSVDSYLILTYMDFTNVSIYPLTHFYKCTDGLQVIISYINKELKSNQKANRNQWS